MDNPTNFSPLFTPLDHQRPVLNYMMNGGKRALLVWHRRSGKDLTFWNISWALAQKRVGIYYYFYPTYSQAKKAVWYGMDEGGIRFLDYIPKALIASTHDTDMRVHFTNGSILQLIGSDNVDSIMSTNPIGCVFSEYALQDPAGWRFVSPILRKNGGWAAFVYTPRGHNHGYELYQNMKNDPNWFVELRTIIDTGLIDPLELDEDRRTGIPEEIIQQEYFCDFNVANEGTYFGQQMTQAEAQGRITQCVYDPRQLVHTAWDLGKNDSCAIWFVQTDGRTVWAIDFFERANNDGLPYFVKVLQEKGYVYGTHLAPHDVTTGNFAHGDNTLQAGYELGIDFTRVPPEGPGIPKREQLQAAHYLLPRTIFDARKCEKGIEGLKAYEREWDRLTKVYSNTPKHNWASHIADAFMVLACGINLLAESNSRVPYSTGRFDPREYERYADFDPRERVTYERGYSREKGEEGYGGVEEWDAQEWKWREGDEPEAGYRNRIIGSSRR